MGEVIRMTQGHARASLGSRAAIPASVSRVISPPLPRSPASRTSVTQYGAGIPPGRSRQPLTVDLESRNASATCVVPPSASMIDPGVVMPDSIVCTVQTSQGFANRQATINPEHVPLAGMVDPQEVVGPRLRALRLALGFKTQKAFAEAIGVDKSTYNPWEKGTRLLTFEGACLIRKKFNIPLDYQFYGQLDGVPAWLRPQLLQQTAA